MMPAYVCDYCGGPLPAPAAICWVYDMGKYGRRKNPGTATGMYCSVKCSAADPQSARDERRELTRQYTGR